MNILKRIFGLFSSTRVGPGRMGTLSDYGASLSESELSQCVKVMGMWYHPRDLDARGLPKLAQ